MPIFTEVKTRLAILYNVCTSIALIQRAFVGVSYGWMMEWLGNRIKIVNNIQ